MSSSPSRKLAVLVSGTGRHLENLCRLEAEGALGGAVSICISSKRGVLALERAADASVPAVVLEKAGADDDRTYGERIFEEIRRAGADTVVLAGFLKRLWIPEDYRGRVINIHPSLLPAFGGKGFYGHRVHSAVLARGCQVSGCTVHLVDEIYDNGPILVQRWCPVEPDDSADTLAARVFEQELEALPEGLRRFWSSNS